VNPPRAAPDLFAPLCPLFFAFIVTSPCILLLNRLDPVFMLREARPPSGPAFLNLLTTLPLATSYVWGERLIVLLTWY